MAFKLVSVSGLVLFPLSAWAMGRLAGAPTPVPAFLSMAAFIFLFDSNFTIYGGNIASTLAGEFAFSISLCLSLLAIGVAIRGMTDGRWLAPGALLIALVALCHIIPVFFLVPALIMAVLAADTVPRSWVLASIVAFGLIPIAFADGRGLAFQVVVVGLTLVVVVAAMVAEPPVFWRGMWLLLTGLSSMAISAFWLLPFYGREPYFNDMGWERLDEVGPPLLTVPIKIALPVAAIGFIVAVANREKIGVIFAGTGLLFAAAVANLGEGPLWECPPPALLLPVGLHRGAVGVAFATRYVASTLSQDLARPDPLAVVAGTAAATLAVLIAVSMPLRIMPFGQVPASGDGTYHWLGLTNQARSLVPGWADWNYSGYEEKTSYAEYHHVVSTMDDVGQQRGCGRAMWEYEKGLDRYGTPMALMLLPHWTNGCIGSMEGLYFESSATTPFHFLNQSKLSEAPSRAQRDLPYGGFDIESGIDQLQVMGVRYYLAQSDVAIDAARNHPDLTEVAEAQPFVVFEVAGSTLVQGLAVEPVVAAGRTAEEVAGPDGEPEEISRFEVGWVSQAVAFYNDPASYPAMPAEDGPAAWTRQELLSPGSGTPIEPAVVTIIDDETDTDSLVFTVDRGRRPGPGQDVVLPQLGRADGADGPWRIGPNLMVVVPTEERVELSYGWTALDLFGHGLSVIGLVALVVLGMMDRGRIFDLRAISARTGTAFSPSPRPDQPLIGVEAGTADWRDWEPEPVAIDPARPGGHGTERVAGRPTDRAGRADERLGPPVRPAGPAPRDGRPGSGAGAGTGGGAGRRAGRRGRWTELGGRDLRSRLRLFAIVGALATAVDIGLFLWLAPDRLDVWLADIVALVAAAVTAYALNRVITFRGDPDARWVHSPGLFAASAVAAGAVDLAALLGLRGLGLDLLPAKTLAVGVGAVVRWTAYRWILFRRVRQDLAERVDRPPAPGDLRLTVVVPAYNEDDRIAATVEAIGGELERHLDPGDHEILVVDDGSRDATVERATEAGARVLAQGVNRGKGASVRAGVLAARGRTVVFTDADLAYPPPMLLRLLDEVEDGWDMVVGSRRHEETATVVHRPRIREIGGSLVNRLTHLVLLGHFRDTQCGLKGFRGDIGRTLFERTRIDGWAFDVELFLMAEQDHLSLRIVPVSVANRAGSSVSVIRDGLALVGDLFRIRRWAGEGLYQPNEAQRELLDARA